MEASGVRPLLLALASLVGLACDAAAQTAAGPATPVDAGNLLRQQQQQQQPATRESREAPPLPPRPEDAATAAGGARVLVREFRLAGDPRAFEPATLLDLLAPARGRSMTLAELAAAVARITTFYREHGYFLGRAVLPPQDLTDGVVTVHVLEGRLDTAQGLSITPAADAAPATLDPALAMQVLAQDLEPGAALSLPRLERNLHLLNDLPGVRAAARLEPGAAPDTTRVVVELEDGPRRQAVASLDNHGSRYTDSLRLGLQFTVDNPTGQGDQLQLQAAQAPSGDYRYARVGYSALATPAGLRLTGSVSELGYRVGADLAALQARGGASVVGVVARQPLQRSRDRNLWATAGLESKQLRNDALGARTSDKRVDLLTLGLAADRRGATGSDWLDLAFAAGTLDLSRVPASLAQDATGPRTQGGFTRWTLGAGRQQVLGPTLTLALQVQAQWAPGNLDSGEKFLLGGAQGVRAYPGSEAAGDRGVRASAELRWLAWHDPTAGALQLSAFVDAGRIRQWARPDGLALATPNHYGLSGAGLGVQFTAPGGHQLRLEAAAPLARNPGRDPRTGHDADGRAPASRVWASVQLRF